MRNIHRIPEAIADLESQEVPNVNATAEKYDVARKTLEDRVFHGNHQCEPFINWMSSSSNLMNNTMEFMN